VQLPSDRPLFVSMKWSDAILLVMVALCCVTIAGCATPVSVERVDPQTAYRERARNVLSSGAISEPTRIVLTRWNLNVQYAADPKGALSALQGLVNAGTAGSDEIFALAELSFQQAELTGNRTDYLGAAVYAFAFLFPDGADAPPSPYDPRLRAASNLYDRGLTLAFESADRARVELRGGEFALPFGKLRVAYDPAGTVWANRMLVDFVPIGEFNVSGLRNNYRQAGLGAPFAATGIPVTPETGLQIAPRMKIPVTAVLRIPDARRRLATGVVDAKLEIHPPSTAETVHLGGQNVPLEIERTAALAYGLADKDIWARELRGFFVGDLLDKVPTRLAALGPYKSGRFPVIFIHGTASSAGRWAEMVNELLSDDRIRAHFQFWFFSYDTGNPIPYSAALLREELRDAVVKVDPGDKDPALRHMVVIGHSQGGLLAKMLVVDSGTRFWDEVSRKPFDQLNLSASTKDLLRRSIFFDHSPYVTRVVFVATPQRGSFVAGFSVTHLLARLFQAPLNVITATADLLTNNLDAFRFDPTQNRIGTSVYGMTPGSPFITAIASLPIAPGIAVHSIVAVNGDGPVESGNDGVVAYSSAHLPEANSELVVRSGHSTQSDPRTIAEVRRILLLHLQDACREGIGCAAPVSAEAVGQDAD
jgi:hypothetical protein